MFKHFISIFIISLILPNLCYSQEEITNEELQQLNNRIEVLENQRDLLNQQIDLKSIELELKFQEFEIDQTKENQYISTLLWVFGTISVLGIIGIIIGGFKTYFKLLAKASELAEQKIDNKFDVLFKENKRQLKKLIYREIEENTLKERKKISVISPAKSDLRFLKSFFDELNFKYVEYYEYKTGIDLERDIDILFINDETGKFTQDQIEKKLPHLPDEVVYFYFGGKRIDIDKNRLAIANFRSQLYGNLINSLRYQELL